MGLNDIIKPPSTVLSKAVIESLQHQITLRLSENYRERRESNPGPQGEKRESSILCLLTLAVFFLFNSALFDVQYSWHGRQIQQTVENDQID